MALVAYGSSDESDLSDNEEEIKPKNVPEPKKSASNGPLNENVVNKIEPEPKFVSGEISDDDDDEWIGHASAGVEDLDIPGLSTSKSIFDALPQVSVKR